MMIGPTSRKPKANPAKIPVVIEISEKEIAKLENALIVRRKRCAYPNCDSSRESLSRGSFKA